MHLLPSPNLQWLQHAEIMVPVAVSLTGLPHTCLPIRTHFSGYTNRQEDSRGTPFTSGLGGLKPQEEDLQPERFEGGRERERERERERQREREMGICGIFISFHFDSFFSFFFFLFFSIFCFSFLH